MYFQSSMLFITLLSHQTSHSSPHLEPHALTRFTLKLFSRTAQKLIANKKSALEWNPSQTNLIDIFHKVGYSTAQCSRVPILQVN